MEVGYEVRKMDYMKHLCATHIFVTASLLYCCGFIIQHFAFSTIVELGSRMGIFPIYMVMGFCGIVILNFLCERLSTYSYVTKVISPIGVYSIVYYGLHMPVFGFIWKALSLIPVTMPNIVIALIDLPLTLASCYIISIALDKYCPILIGKRR